MRLPKFGLNRWKNPDHAIRLDYAQRSGNQKRLLHLAVGDVNESVRMAAAKNLRTDRSRLLAIEHASNERICQYLVDALETDAAREAVAGMDDLPARLRRRLSRCRKSIQRTRRRRWLLPSLIG